MRKKRHGTESGTVARASRGAAVFVAADLGYALCCMLVLTNALASEYL
jgi:hypothetical protein